MDQKYQTKFTKLHQQAGLSFDEAIALIEVSRSTGFRYQNGTSEPKGAVLRLLEDAAAYRAAETPGWFTFIDLFAGIGGLRIGFEGIGGRCVFTSEWDPNSRKTYANNFPDNHEIAGDIREFSKSPELIPEHDVLLAGLMNLGSMPRSQRANGWTASSSSTGSTFPLRMIFRVPRGRVFLASPQWTMPTRS